MIATYRHYLALIKLPMRQCKKMMLNINPPMHGNLLLFQEQCQVKTAPIAMNCNFELYSPTFNNIKYKTKKYHAARRTFNLMGWYNKNTNSLKNHV